MKKLIKKLVAPLLRIYKSYRSNDVSHVAVKELYFGGHVVLSLPKCGGSTLHHTIQETFPFLFVYHIHALSPKGMEKFISENAELIDKGYHDLAKAIEGHLIGAARFKLGGGMNESNSLYVVSGIRDPVALGISQFFQNFKHHINSGDNIDTKRVHEFVVHNVFKKSVMKGGIDEWFKEEIEDALGFDLLGQPFDPNIGFRIYKKSQHINHKLLLLRLESFDRISEALGELYEVPAQLFRVVNANTSEEKGYKELYKRVLGEIQFEREFLDDIYSSKYIRKFYSEIEINRMLERWAHGVGY